MESEGKICDLKTLAKAANNAGHCNELRKTSICSVEALLSESDGYFVAVCGNHAVGVDARSRVLLDPTTGERSALCVENLIASGLTEDLEVRRLQ